MATSPTEKARAEAQKRIYAQTVALPAEESRKLALAQQAKFSERLRQYRDKLGGVLGRFKQFDEDAAAIAQHIEWGDELTAKTDEESRKVADALVTQVRGELTRALESSGPLRAVVVCKYSMPEISSNLSRKHGWRISRVSLKARNPALGMPDTWEQRVLQHFDQQVSRGEKAGALEHGEVVSEPAGKYFRYMRALVMGPLCQACHGTPDQISEAIRAQLALEYPSDTAIGYRLGQVRGAVTIKRPLD